MSTKEEVNLKLLTSKAIKNDKSFLYYDNSKSKINTIIRKNKLEDFVVEYLWASKIYKKEILKHQVLTNYIRKDVIYNCKHNYPSSPWVSVLKNFLKLHNPTKKELESLIRKDYTPDTNKPRNKELVIMCWEVIPKKCYEFGFKEDFIHILKNIMTFIYRTKNFDSNRLNYTIVSIFKSVEEMRIPMLEAINTSVNSPLIIEVLLPVVKSVKMTDEVVDYMMTNYNKRVFKNLMKSAIHKENLSENMTAKVYLTLE